MFLPNTMRRVGTVTLRGSVYTLKATYCRALFPRSVYNPFAFPVLWRTWLPLKQLPTILLQTRSITKLSKDPTNVVKPSKAKSASVTSEKSNKAGAPRLKSTKDATLRLRLKEKKEANIASNLQITEINPEAAISSTVKPPKKKKLSKREPEPAGVPSKEEIDRKIQRLDQLVQQRKHTDLDALLAEAWSTEPAAPVKVKPPLQLDELMDLLIDWKAEDPVVMDVRTKSNIADYVVIVSSRSGRHSLAMAEKLVDELKSRQKPSRDYLPPEPDIDGRDCPEWMAVDCGDILVNFMSPTTRAEYDIEELYVMRPPMDQFLALEKDPEEDPWWDEELD